MKRFVTIIVFIVFTAHSFAQGLIKGTIKDITTGQVIDKASIYTGDLKLHTISNPEGNFQLAYPAGTEKILLKYLGYHDLIVKVNKLPQDDIYYLEPQAFDLNEIVVTNIPVSELLEKLVVNSVKRLQSPAVVHTYYREFNKINGTYTKFADGLLDYSLEKNKKGTEVNTSLYVQQSRAVQLPEQVEEASLRGIGSDVRTALKDMTNFSIIREEFLDKKQYAKYEYSIQKRTGTDGAQLQTIIIAPKPGVKEVLLEGTITYDAAENLIMDVELGHATSLLQYIKVRNFIIGKGTVEYTKEKNTYVVTNGIYLPSYSYSSGKVHVWNNKYDNTYTLTSDCIVTNYDNSTPTSGKFRHRSLYEAGNNYTEKFWEGNNAVMLTQEQQDVIQSLSGSIPGNVK